MRDSDFKTKLFLFKKRKGKTILTMHITKYNRKGTEKEITRPPKLKKKRDNCSILIG